MKKIFEKTRVMLSALLMAMLAFSCDKDLSFESVEPIFEGGGMSAGATFANCSVRVTYPGSFTVEVEWSLSPDMASPQRQTLELAFENCYETKLTGLNKTTTYYYRITMCNSYMSRSLEVMQFTTREKDTPDVVTLALEKISFARAVGGGNVSFDGGLYIKERGVCWSISHNPTVSDSHASSGVGTGSFTVTMTGLEPNTTYYVRAYVVNGNGTYYGDEVSFTTADLPEGAVKGEFSVSANKQVCFSQGNLQYQASTNIWRFAEHQYDYVGDANSTSSYSGWIDLFGWGTSGYNGKHPHMTSTNSSDYGNGNNNISGTNYDWGVYNPISNGGNTANTWRTLTIDEWVYVFNTRTTSSGIRYAKACVNSVNGVILLPDDWSTSTYSLSSTNSSGANFTANTITATQWTTLEQHGAVFLPAAGYRNGTSVHHVGSRGYYWSASYDYEDYAYGVWFYSSYLNPQNYGYRSLGLSVRLVRFAQ